MAIDLVITASIATVGGKLSATVNVAEVALIALSYESSTVAPIDT